MYDVVCVFVQLMYDVVRVFVQLIYDVVRIFVQQLILEQCWGISTLLDNLPCSKQLPPVYLPETWSKSVLQQ
jgi:hypothetical protein